MSLRFGCFGTELGTKLHLLVTQKVAARLC